MTIFLFRRKAIAVVESLKRSKRSEYRNSVQDEPATPAPSVSWMTRRIALRLPQHLGVNVFCCDEHGLQYTGRAFGRLVRWGEDSIWIQLLRSQAKLTVLYQETTLISTYSLWRLVTWSALGFTSAWASGDILCGA
ncbi:hypothetical protein PM082_022812 [Marasmius tenuissimus]|nr:hypothetical protein PM082_022812 [Marasmius tenuissimus]